MRLTDLDPVLAAELAEAVPSGPQTPEQMRQTAKKKQAAQARVQDVKKANAQRLAAAQRKAGDL